MILRTWHCTTSSPSVTPSPSLAESTGWRRWKPRRAWISSLTSWIYLRSRVWFEIWGKRTCRRQAVWVWGGGTLHCGTRLFVETLRVSCRSALNNIAVHLPMGYQYCGTVAHWKKNQQWNTLTGFTDVRFRRGFHYIPSSVHFHSFTAAFGLHTWITVAHVHTETNIIPLSLTGCKPSAHKTIWLCLGGKERSDKEGASNLSGLELCSWKFLPYKHNPYAHICWLWLMPHRDLSPPSHHDNSQMFPSPN